MVLVDDELLKARTLCRSFRSGVGIGPLIVDGLDGLMGLVHPSSERHVGRRRISAFVVDFLLDKERTETAIDVIEWLQDVYPRTPVVIYTGGGLVDVALACRSRELTVVPSDALPTEQWDPAASLLRDALLGLVQLPGGEDVPVVRTGALVGPLFRYCDQRLFAPWDERCIEIRSWLLSEAGESAAQVHEYHLCTLDAYFDSLAVGELAFARGVEQATIRQNIKEIRALWNVDEIDVLRARWERRTLGRGVRSRALPWRVPPAPTAPPSPVTLEYEYNDHGNLRRVLDPDTLDEEKLEYNRTNNAGLHGASTYNGDPLSYDAEGRLTTGAKGRTFEYNELNLPRVIRSENGEASIRYDANGERARMNIATPGGDYETEYVGRWYEARTTPVGTSHVHYVHGPEGVVAQLVVIGGGLESFFYHGDGLGSVSLVTDGSGAEVTRQWFSPFGRRMNPDGTFADPAGSGSIPDVTRGFTGHEHDDTFGLINMGGRIYDPMLRRFATADPFVGAGRLSQSTNRYSYVGNSPLRYLFPPGLCSTTSHGRGDTEVCAIPPNEHRLEPLPGVDPTPGFDVREPPPTSSGATQSSGGDTTLPSGGGAPHVPTLPGRGGGLMQVVDHPLIQRARRDITRALARADAALRGEMSDAHRDVLRRWFPDVGPQQVEQVRSVIDALRAAIVAVPIRDQSRSIAEGGDVGADPDFNAIVNSRLNSRAIAENIAMRDGRWLPFEHRYIAVYARFFNEPHLGPTRILHELVHYLDRQGFQHRGPVFNVWRIQGFVSEIAGLTFNQEYVRMCAQDAAGCE